MPVEVDELTRERMGTDVARKPGDDVLERPTWLMAAASVSTAGSAMNRSDGRSSARSRRTRCRSSAPASFVRTVLRAIAQHTGNDRRRAVLRAAPGSLAARAHHPRTHIDRGPLAGEGSRSSRAHRGWSSGGVLPDPRKPESTATGSRPPFAANSDTTPIGEAFSRRCGNRSKPAGCAGERDPADHGAYGNEEWCRLILRFPLSSST